MRRNPPDTVKIISISGALIREIKSIRLRPKRSLNGPATRMPATPAASKIVKANPAIQILPVSSLMKVGRKVVMDACIKLRAIRIPARGLMILRVSCHVCITELFFELFICMGIALNLKYNHNEAKKPTIITG